MLDKINGSEKGLLAYIKGHPIKEIDFNKVTINFDRNIVFYTGTNNLEIFENKLKTLWKKKW